jgi:hypothetical protein
MTHPKPHHDRRRIALIELQGLGDASPFVPGVTPANTPGTISYIPPSDAPAPAAAASTGPSSAASTGPSFAQWLAIAGAALSLYGLARRKKTR